MRNLYIITLIPLFYCDRFIINEKSKYILDIRPEENIVQEPNWLAALTSGGLKEYYF